MELRKDVQSRAQAGPSRLQHSAVSKDAVSGFERLEINISVEPPCGKSLAGMGNLFLSGTQERARQCSSHQHEHGE